MRTKCISFNIAVIIFIHFLGISLHASSYGPTLIFHKPSSTLPYAHQFSMSFGYGKTRQGYNKHGKTVPFLQEYGTEDLLKKFIDDTDPLSIKKMGEVNFSGTLHFERLNLNYVKNIHHNLFIGIGTTIQNLSINDITMGIKLTETLTPQQEKGIALLRSKIPDQINSSGMYSTTISFGYNKIFKCFESLEFLQLYLKGSIATPQSISGHYLSILQYPLAGNIAFSYPFTAIVTAGISPHLNVGIFGLVVPFQQTLTKGFVNNHATKNDILLTEIRTLQVHPKPVFAGTLYLESHNFINNLNLLWGCGAAHGMQWNITPIDTIKTSKDFINRTERLNPWYISSMFFQLNYSFRSEERPHAPSLSIYYVFPIAGMYFPKLNTFGGSYSLAFTHNF